LSTSFTWSENKHFYVRLQYLFEIQTKTHHHKEVFESVSGGQTTCVCSRARDEGLWSPDSPSALSRNALQRKQDYQEHPMPANKSTRLLAALRLIFARGLTIRDHDGGGHEE